ncbi:hypothetical protein BLD25_02505 [Candidatus Gracilibacteria bacterium GN02-872]|nr:oligosaccharide flippase family protein [Candidatus Gracilibacteria bacterium]RAL57503.1 hypothetical protein BLD25_02505 [Candidatus Gracilibacteria bacterium GN02-872]
MKKNNYFYIVLFGFSGIIGGLINYIYHPIMLRFMSIEEFGIFSSLISIFNILSVVTIGFDLFLNKEFSRNLDDEKKVKSVFVDSTKIFGIIGITLFALFTVFSPFIANFLGIQSNFLVIISGLILVFSFGGISASAFLKSSKSFEVLSFNDVLAPVARLVFGVLFVFLGLGILGAVLGFIASYIISLLFILYFSFGKLKNIDYKPNTKKLFKDFIGSKTELFNFFFVSLIFSIFMNVDMLIARNIFSSGDAGIYGGITVLGKFLIFLLLAIETIYYGQIMKFKKSEIPKNLLITPILVIAGLIVFSLIFNYFFGEFLLGILKPEFKNYLDIFLLNLTYYGFLAFISFFMKVSIGLNFYKINIISSILLIFLFVFIYKFSNHSLYEFSLSFALFGIISTFILAVFFFFECKKLKAEN